MANEMDSSRTLVYWCFLILGISSLLPWNLYMTAHQYFSYKLRNTTTWPSNSSSAPIGNYSLTPLQRTFETYLTASGSAISIVGAVGNTLLTSKLTNGVRVSVGHLFVFLPLLPTIALAWINTDEEQVGFFVATLLLGNIANLAANGFIGGGAMGLAARFRADLMQSVILGQAVAGVLVSLGSIASQALTPDPILNGLVYFICAAVWTGISQLTYWILVRTRFAHEMAAAAAEPNVLDEDDEPLLGDENDFPGYGGEDDDYDWTRPLQLRQSDLTEAPLLERLGAVFSEIKTEALAIVICYITTLSLFPSLTSLVVSTSTNDSWRKYFIPVACFLVFNVGDATGRLLSKWIRYPRSGKGLLAAVLVRILFIPLLFLCNVQPRYHTSTLFDSDAIFLILIASLAVSNGLIVSLASMYGAERANATIKELTGSVLSAVIAIGVLIGSLLSLLFVNLV